MITKIGVIGDVHAEDKTLEKVLDFLSVKELDAILCTGDIIDGPGDVNVCFELLHKAGALTVSGNHERWLIMNTKRDLPDATARKSVSYKTLERIVALPKNIEMATPAGLLLLCHGLGANDMAVLRPYTEKRALECNYDLQNLLQAGRYTYVIGGHTHQKMARKFNQMTVINAGTLKHDRAPCFLIIDFIKNLVQFYRMDFEGVIGKGNAYTLQNAAN